MDPAQFLERLKDLDLSEVAITAALDAEGRLGPVGGLRAKLLGAADDAATPPWLREAESAALLGELRLVVIAEKQPDVPPALEREDA